MAKLIDPISASTNSLAQSSFSAQISCADRSSPSGSPMRISLITSRTPSACQAIETADIRVSWSGTTPVSITLPSLIDRPIFRRRSMSASSQALLICARIQLSSIAWPSPRSCIASVPVAATVVPTAPMGVQPVTDRPLEGWRARGRRQQGNAPEAVCLRLEGTIGGKHPGTA